MRTKRELAHWVDELDKASVLVIGDVMLDRFIYGSVARISPEAPVPVLRTGDIKPVLGGAGNVVRNIIALGSQASFISVIGDDHEGREIEDMLAKIDRLNSKLIVEEKRKTTVKTRYIAERQQVLRVDSETTHDVSEGSIQRIIQEAESMMESCNLVIISDYGKGLLCKEVLSAVIASARRHKRPVLVDPKGKDFTRYQGASIITPNLRELEEATGIKIEGDDTVVNAAQQLISTCELDGVLATRSQEGMTLVLASGEVTHLKAEAKEVFDVTGAGDTAIAALSVVIGAGAPWPEAAELANIAAGIVVGKLGTAVVYPAELLQALHHQELSGAEGKILDLHTALDRVDQWRRKGHKIGFTNGIFDLLHPGHISLLAQAAAVCDRLVVGLNGDLSVRTIKGADPIQNEYARSTILASLENVDMVIVFQEDMPLKLLHALRPDVLIKGANYRPEAVIGADIVKKYGGEIYLANVMNVVNYNEKIAGMTSDTL